MTYGEKAGVLMDLANNVVWVAAVSSRCLYGGYRYEAPLAGATKLENAKLQTTLRQQGTNFAGQHYTLHRHYDPVLMRFTSPDPIAAEFWNLNSYSGNSPARYFDPDGLFKLDLFEIGGRKFSIDTDGYAERAKTTAVGAAVGGWDAVTFGQHLTDDDRYGLALAYGVDPNSGYYAAGQIAGNITVSAAFGVASGGLANMTHVGRAAMIGKTLGKALKASMIAGDTIEASGAAAEFAETGDWSMRQTMALVGAGAAGGGYALGKAFKVMCFVEGTQVAVQGEHGLAGKPIEQIEVGDLVWARDEFTGEEGFKPVVHLFRNQADTLVHLTYTTSANTTPVSITGTTEHPFWSVTRNNWVPMAELHAGETLLLAGGRTATVTNTRTEHLTTPVKIYNLEVADWHTYYVGSTQTGWVWVHNKNCNGNRVRSGRAQHGYEIVDQQTGKVVKTGVSGGKLTSRGGVLRSARADRQAAKWNREAWKAGDHGPAGRYYARVVHQEAAGPWARKRILDWEKAHAQLLRGQGHLKDRDFHVRP